MEQTMNDDNDGYDHIPLIYHPDGGESALAKIGRTLTSKESEPRWLESATAGLCIVAVFHLGAQRFLSADCEFGDNDTRERMKELAKGFNESGVVVEVREYAVPFSVLDAHQVDAA